MKVQGGLINLINPIDRVIDVDAGYSSSGFLTGGFTEDVIIQNTTTDELWFVSRVSLSIVCIAAPTSGNNESIRLFKFDGSVGNQLFNTPSKVLGVKDAFSMNEPLELWLPPGKGLMARIQSISAGGLYDTNMSLIYTRYSKL